MLLKIPTSLHNILPRETATLSLLIHTAICNLIYSRDDLKAQQIELPIKRILIETPGPLLDIEIIPEVPSELLEDFKDYIDIFGLSQETAIVFGLFKTLADRESYLAYRCNNDEVFRNIVKIRYFLTGTESKLEDSSNIKSLMDC